MSLVDSLLSMQRSSEASCLDAASAGLAEEQQQEYRSGKKQAKGKKNSRSETFVWTDDEVELLLACAAEYKTQKASEGIDWETTRSKYADILDAYRKIVAAAEDTGKYKHRPDEVGKDVVTSKLKNIRAKYREAVESGRRSGHGRVVLLYFELCENIWGGSPATAEISSGIETGDVSRSTTSTSSVVTRQSSSDDGGLSINSSCSVDADADDDVVQPEPSVDCGDEGASGHCLSATLSKAPVNSRRQLLDEKLNTYMHQKLKRKVPAEQQLDALDRSQHNGSNS